MANYVLQEELYPFWIFHVTPVVCITILWEQISFWLCQDYAEEPDGSSMSLVCSSPHSRTEGYLALSRGASECSCLLKTCAWCPDDYLALHHYIKLFLSALRICINQPPCSAISLYSWPSSWDYWHLGLRCTVCFPLWMPFGKVRLPFFWPSYASRLLGLSAS